MAAAQGPHRLELTWLGHGTFHLRTVGGRSLLLDAWVGNNPTCPEPWKERVRAGLDAVLISHGHFDHIHDAVDLARAGKPRLVAIFETAHWLQGQGCPDVLGMNKGGTVTVAPGVRASMVHAEHSCGISDGDRIIYGGEACGYVLHLEDGRRLYHAGDTAVFGDMRLIQELWQPEVAILPIGGLYTMDPDQAAYACELLGVRTVVPGHYATFPALEGTPEALRHALRGRGLWIEVVSPEPGETVAV